MSVDGDFDRGVAETIVATAFLEVVDKPRATAVDRKPERLKMWRWCGHPHHELQSPAPRYPNEVPVSGVKDTSQLLIAIPHRLTRSREVAVGRWECTPPCPKKHQLWRRGRRHAIHDAPYRSRRGWSAGSRHRERVEED